MMRFLSLLMAVLAFVLLRLGIGAPMAPHTSVTDASGHLFPRGGARYGEGVTSVGEGENV